MSFNESLRMVSLLIGQERFEWLLVLLPDEFYGLTGSQREQAWQGILAQANRGVRDPERLAQSIDFQSILNLPE
jgi:hypothetical protein